MKKALFSINKGFSLIEILISVFVFLIFSFVFFNIAFNSINQISHAVDKERAVSLAEEGLEAVRSIKNNDFNLLIDGTYGLNVSNNQFNLSGSADLTDIFTRTIMISTIENDFSIKRIESTVTWPNNKSVSLISYLTNWSEIIDQPPIIETCQDYCFSLNYTTGVCRQNARQCQNNQEIYEVGGDLFCPGPPMRNCCCQ